MEINDNPVYEQRLKELTESTIYMIEEIESMIDRVFKSNHDATSAKLVVGHTMFMRHAHYLSKEAAGKMMKELLDELVKIT